MTRQVFLAGLKELPGLAIIHRESDPLTPADLGDAFLDTKTIQKDPDLLFSRIFSTVSSTNIPDHFFRRLLA